MLASYMSEMLSDWGKAIDQGSRKKGGKSESTKIGLGESDNLRLKGCLLIHPQGYWSGEGKGEVYILPTPSGSRLLPKLGTLQEIAHNGKIRPRSPKKCRKSENASIVRMMGSEWRS